MYKLRWDRKDSIGIYDNSGSYYGYLFIADRMIGETIFYPVGDEPLSIDDVNYISKLMCQIIDNGFDYEQIQK